MFSNISTTFKMLNAAIGDRAEGRDSTFVYRVHADIAESVKNELHQIGYDDDEICVNTQKSTISVPLRYPEEEDQHACDTLAGKLGLHCRVKNRNGFKSKKWERDMIRDDQDNIDVMWNHRVTHFDTALKKASEEGKLDLSAGAEATDIKLFQLDTGRSDHPRLTGYKRYNTELSRNFFRKGGPRAGDDYRGLPQGPGHSTSTGFTIIGTKSSNEPFDPSMRKGKKFEQELNEGLFPCIEFVPIRVARSVVLGKRTAKSMYEAVRYAVDNGADVLAMSMAGVRFWEYYEDADNYAYENGVIFVCAAGSELDFFTDVMSPAANDHTIAVSGISTQRRKDTYELIPLPRGNDGEATVISAPAKWVFTAGKKKRKNYHRLGVGTSQSTAHVAAAAALWKHYWRNELICFADTPSLLVDSFRYGLTKSMDIPDNWSAKDLRENKGVLNVEKLLEYNPVDLIDNM